jgi:hypothetical protein
MSAPVQVPAHAAAYVQYVEEDPAIDLVQTVSKIAAGDERKVDVVELNRLVDDLQYGKLLDRLSKVMPSGATKSSSEGMQR